MKRSLLLGLLLVGLATAVWTAAGRAQDVIDTDACERACEAQKDACIDQCDDEDNPVECEASCDDRAEDCVRRCGG
jgi:hypothetical protein